MRQLSFDDALDIAEYVLDSHNLKWCELDMRADGMDGWYFFEHRRGDKHIVIGTDETHLSATSAISPTKLLDAYFMGRRD